MIEILDPQTGELLDTDSVPGLAVVAGLHDDQIYRLSMVVAQLEEADAEGSTAPWNWRTLKGQAAAAQWRDLADWVGWLRGRYPLARQIPACWWRHPELVEELTALWLAWKDGYATKHAHFSAPAEWHARWLPDFLRRVGAGGWNLSCEGEHKERVLGLYDDRRVDDEGYFAAHIAAETGSTNDSKEETGMKTKVDDTTMQAALASGEGRSLGDLPDSPVAYADAYWTPTEDGWVQIDNPETVDFLEDAERRLRLADEAVARVEES